MPNKKRDASSVFSLRLPDALLERLDRYLDWMEIQRGEKSSRNHAIHRALTKWLDIEEEQGGMSHPDVLRRNFHSVYISLRSGQDEVDIHRMRQLLKWPTNRFDSMVEQLRAESQVVLHVGGPGDLSDEERRRSYEVNGQLYVTLSWLD